MQAAGACRASLSMVRIKWLASLGTDLVVRNAQIGDERRGATARRAPQLSSCHSGAAS